MSPKKYKDVSFNESLNTRDTHYTYCEMCKSRRPENEINIEARVHHDAKIYRCYNQVACRKRRKKK